MNQSYDIKTLNQLFQMKNWHRRRDDKYRTVDRMTNSSTKNINGFVSPLFTTLAL